MKWPLDREEHNLYVINVTASDGLFVCHTTVQVTVVDTNDNSPVCDKVRALKKAFEVNTGAKICRKWQF